MSEFSNQDRLTLQMIQARVPLVREPYARLAAELECDEGDLLDRLSRLRAADGVVREISGVFDAGSLGYRQVLAAFAVGSAGMDGAGQAVAAHPGVSHCYARQGRYDLWFTLAVSPASSLGMEATLARLADQANARASLMLPATRCYKLRLTMPLLMNGLDLDETSLEPPVGPFPPRPAPPSEEQVRAVRALQVDLPNRPDPFSGLAELHGLGADMLLVHAADLLAAGRMRRYAAVLRHRAAGAMANVLVAWRADPQAAEAAGIAAAQVQAISHCYLRRQEVDWPYSFYTMIHGRDRPSCLRTIDHVAAVTGLEDRAELWTVKEYKKQRVRFFTDHESKWERQTEGRQ